MIKIENIEIFNIEGAMRGMRNPKNSWYKNDTIGNKIGDNDLSLATRLTLAGPEHAKFLRQIFVSFDLTAPMFFWKEFDTYKVGVTRNSCSTMHKLHTKELTTDDFSIEGIKGSGDIYLDNFREYIKILNELRELFNKTNEKKYWRALVEMLPSNYQMKSTITMDYQNLRNIYFQRRNHKLFEWHDFCKIIEDLPYGKELICIEKEN